jgi:GH25 family lysozyme M1 (1,4-beta-N-acetylmuramidase)
VRTTAAAVRRVRRPVVVLVTSLAAMLASTLAYADGVDVSHWQGTISWSKVKAAGMQFAFMKATESTTYTDSQLATNWAGVQAVGMYRGAYHFARPRVGTASAQAKYFVSKVGSFKGAGTLPPVLDLEASGGLGVTALRSWTASWLQTVEQLTGRTPIIYVSPAFWEHYLGNSTAFTRYPLWIAHYGVSTPRVPGGWPTWTFWQRTSSGTVSGISGNVDMNRFNGTTAQLASLANTTGGSSAPVPPGVTIATGEPTVVSLTPSTAKTTAINGPVTLAGDLRQTDPTLVLADLPVTLYARPVGATAWSAVSTIKTGPSGQYSFTTRVPQATDYSVAFAGSTVYAGSASAPTRVSTPARLGPTVYLHKNKTSRVRRGTSVMVYGHLKTSLGPVTGKYVRFYKRPARGGRWTYVRASKSLAPTGWYSTTVRPRRSTTYKAVSIADTYRLAATSNFVTVWVR